MDTSSKTIPYDDIQGILLHGYGHLHEARFLLLAVERERWREARRFFATLPLTSATVAGRRVEEPGPFVNVAFTHSGLEVLRLPAALLDDFPQDYVEGPTVERRARLLGDEGESHPSQWQWGSRDKPAVHAVVLLYAKDGIDALCDQYHEAARRADLDPHWCLDTIRLPRRQEHFGFHDGIAQPVLRVTREKVPPHNTIAAGEMLLGHENEFQERSPVPGESVTKFAHDGTYLVLRQLEQDVGAFWRFCREHAESDKEAIHLGARMVGRWPSGAPLVRHPQADPHMDGDDNAFGYTTHPKDVEGYACPLGAHVRRSNPRDSAVTGNVDESLRVAARHRIIRRGRAYGPPFAGKGEPEQYLAALADGSGSAAKRGLNFLGFNANIERQFEFVQQQWCNNPKFAGAANGPDAVIGNHRPFGGAPPTFSIQDPVAPRRIRDMGRFVHVRGGAYFFMPSISAVRSLDEQSDA
jgi:Dyp-type peroxidase family